MITIISKVFHIIWNIQICAMVSHSNHAIYFDYNDALNKTVVISKVEILTIYYSS